MYAKPIVTTQYVVSIHRTDGTEWSTRVDNHASALEAAMDWVTVNGLEEDPDETFISIVPMQVVLIEHVEPTNAD